MALIGNGIDSERLKKGFNQATTQVQDSIIEHFQSAINRAGASRFFSDRELVRDVTPEKEIKIRVFELRIFTPVAYRCYFHETENKTYLALVEQKPAPRVQDNQIKNAAAIIKELIATSN